MKHFLILCFFLLVKTTAVADDGRFVEKEHIIYDKKNAIEWLRCSVGQTWNGSTCTGKVINLTMDEVDYGLKVAGAQRGGNWRLPNKTELMSIVCKSCGVPKIDERIFPNTDNAPYWTNDKSFFDTNHLVSVSFHTGYSYNKFTKIKPLAVRLVRDPSRK